MDDTPPSRALLTILLSLLASLTTGAHLVVDTGTIVSRVDPEYVSVTLDFELVATPPGIPRWYTFDSRSPRVITLLRGLSPCYLRFGGSQADMTVLSHPPAAVLYNLPTALKLNTIFYSDIDRLVDLTRASGNRLLYDLNLNVRYAGGWDPTNALRIMDYMASRGYGENVDFELGNEPDLSKSNIVPPWPYPPPQQEPDAYREALLSGKQIGADYLTLRQLIHSIPNFKDSRLVGADIVTVGGLQKLMPDFLKIAGTNITATTFHHYYFNGLGAHPSEYIKPQHFDSIRYNIKVVKDLVKEYSPRKDLPVWIGETADAWHSGTQNVSDRYISGFLWLDKLGLSAQLGVTVVMRQTFYGGFYALINGQLYPNPDYWVSYIHKQLVGRAVFNTSLKDNGKMSSQENQLGRNKINKPLISSSEVTLVRLYSHCTKPSLQYSRGSLIIFGVNLKNQTEVVTFDPTLANQKVDLYVLTPGGQDGLLSSVITLNGKPLHLVDDVTLPPLRPVTMATATSGIRFPGLTMAFFVFPDANITACHNET